MSHYSEVPKVAIYIFIIYWTLANIDKKCNKSRKVKFLKNCIQCLYSSVNVYDTRVTSVWVCVAMYGEFFVSNATGSFQNHCSVASQMNPFADEPSSSGTGTKRPIRRRDMTALLLQSHKSSKTYCDGWHYGSHIR